MFLPNAMMKFLLWYPPVPPRVTAVGPRKMQNIRVVSVSHRLISRSLQDDRPSLDRYKTTLSEFKPFLAPHSHLFPAGTAFLPDFAPSFRLLDTTISLAATARHKHAPHIQAARHLVCLCFKDNDAARLKKVFLFLFPSAINP